MRHHTPPPRRVTAAVAACVTVPLVVGLVGAPTAFAAADDPLPRPIVEYTFDGDATASVIANEGSKGAAFDARVRNAASLARGAGPTSDAGASGLFPGAAQGASSSACA